MQQALVDPTLQIDSDGPHVADDLVCGLFKGEEHTFLPASAGGVDEMSRQAGFPRAGRSGHQNAAAPIIALAAEHGVQGSNTGGNPLIGRHMLQVRRGHRQHGNAVALNQEGILVRPVGGAAVLDHAQAPRQYRFGDAVVEQDDAIRNVLFQAVARQRALPAFPGNDGREVSSLSQRNRRRSSVRRIDSLSKSGEQSLDAVQQHAFGADRIHGVTQPDEQGFQIVLAGLLDQAPFQI